LFGTTTAFATSLIWVERTLAADPPKIGLVHPVPKGPIPSMSAVVAGLAALG
jgi:hypothetical protein